VAAELFQDVWASLIRVRASYEPRAKFSTWLYRMAHNRLIDHLRLVPRAPLPLEEELIPAAAEHERPEAQALAGESAGRLRRALAALPVEQREAFLLHEEAEPGGNRRSERSGTRDHQEPAALRAGQIARGAGR
jgi:RNA polymerase sigma-70 factor (ECF subfamily)